MADDLVISLLPSVQQSTRAGFNVFDVMRHGTHEKQLSNVFGWLLDIDGTHGLTDLFQRIFVDQVNRQLTGQERFDAQRWVVRQEINTSEADRDQDIADLILDGDGQRLVVENYYTSDGHGHNYCNYLNYAKSRGRRGAVVLLCRDMDGSLQTDGWEKAAVLTYATLIAELLRQLEVDYPQRHPEAYSFIQQMHRKFVAGKGRMDDVQVLDFVTAVCATGQAERYRDRNQEAARRKFAEDVAVQAAERFDDGRDLLQRIKSKLRNYCQQHLQTQLNETVGAGFVTSVSARYAGIYQWTVNLAVSLDAADGPVADEYPLQVKFGPSAWYANEADSHPWRGRVPGQHADYSHLFLTARGQYIRQSEVTLNDVLDGLAPNDMRLRDEIVALLHDSRPRSGGQSPP